jgi:hypothetical protein
LAILLSETLEDDDAAGLIVIGEAGYPALSINAMEPTYVSCNLSRDTNKAYRREKMEI